MYILVAGIACVGVPGTESKLIGETDGWMWEELQGGVKLLLKSPRRVTEQCWVVGERTRSLSLLLRACFVIVLGSLTFFNLANA